MNTKEDNAMCRISNVLVDAGILNPRAPGPDMSKLSRSFRCDGYGFEIRLNRNWRWDVFAGEGVMECVCPNVPPRAVPRAVKDYVALADAQLDDTP